MTKSKLRSVAQTQINDAASAALLRAAVAAETVAESHGRELSGIPHIAAAMGRSESTLLRRLRGANWPSDLIARLATATGQHPIEMLYQGMEKPDA